MKQRLRSTMLRRSTSSAAWNAQHYLRRRHGGLGATRHGRSGGGCHRSAVGGDRCLTRAGAAGTPRGRLGVGAVLLLAAVLAGPRLMAVYRSGARVDLLGWAGAAGLAMIALGAAWRWFNRRP